MGCPHPEPPVVSAPSFGALAQSVRALPCHGRGCGFEPRRLRHPFSEVKWMAGCNFLRLHGSNFPDWDCVGLMITLLAARNEYSSTRPPTWWLSVTLVSALESSNALGIVHHLHAADSLGQVGSGGSGEKTKQGGSSKASGAHGGFGSSDVFWTPSSIGPSHSPVLVRVLAARAQAISCGRFRERLLGDLRSHVLDRPLGDREPLRGATAHGQCQQIEIQFAHTRPAAAIQ